MINGSQGNFEANDLENKLVEASKAAQEIDAELVSLKEILLIGCDGLAGKTSSATYLSRSSDNEQNCAKLFTLTRMQIAFDD